MSQHLDGYVFQSTAEKDLDRERTERDQMQARREAAKQALVDAQAASIAKREADELAAIETRLRHHFVGTADQREREKAGLIQAERHRLMQESDAQAKRVAAAQYM